MHSVTWRIRQVTECHQLMHFFRIESEWSTRRKKEVLMLVLEESRSIEFREDKLLVKTLSDEQDLRASYHLRRSGVCRPASNGLQRRRRT